MKKTVAFTPLRFIKKSGKIYVASYAQWRKVMAADYADFDLVIGDTHKTMNKDSIVHNHKGEQLFFYNYNPSDVLIFSSSVVLNLDWIRNRYSQYGIDYGTSICYSIKGCDVDGVPAFSHYTVRYIEIKHTNISEFVPLTVGMVLHWYGWFLWQLNNSSLIRKHKTA